MTLRDLGNLGFKIVADPGTALLITTPHPSPLALSQR
jgi:hypothetical protein